MAESLYIFNWDVFLIFRFTVFFAILYLIKKTNIIREILLPLIYVKNFKQYHKIREDFFDIKIFYYSRKGLSLKFSTQLLVELLAEGYHVSLVNVEQYEPENLTNESCLCLFFISSYPIEDSNITMPLLLQWVFEAPNDFRIDRHCLKKCKFAVFGCGDSAYGSDFNLMGKQLHKNLVILGAQPVIKFYAADQSGRGVKTDFYSWKSILYQILKLSSQSSDKKSLDIKVESLVGLLGKKKKYTFKKHKKESLINQDNMTFDSCKSSITMPKSQINDVEDIGNILQKVVENGKLHANKNSSFNQVTIKNAKIHSVSAKKNLSHKDSLTDGIDDNRLPSMLTPETREALTKQGYKVIGEHSAVKICRWTKSALRGRGGCYKHSFYGIDSSRCIESTPSLACANKCVFCWRHHSNPVGTEWKWQMDDPESIFMQVVEQHKGMIKQMKGIPGVTPEKLAIAMVPRHCALSLVGEPIMYPKINQFISYLHDANISTFLVTNAQFPDQIKNLGPVTQLYVSIDAHDATSLKKIDRPLHRDFWERFIECLKAVALKKGITRTVYRMTLVKKWNFSEKYCQYSASDDVNDNRTPIQTKLPTLETNLTSLAKNYTDLFDEDIRNYVELIKLGRPDFIEIKGVTFCGTAGSELTMKDIPWHCDVVEFGRALAAAANHPIHHTNNKIAYSSKLPLYEIACEHEHSNCVLLSDTKFKLNDIWHTWIDYEKFNVMAKNYYKACKAKDLKEDDDFLLKSAIAEECLDSLAYSCLTPSWSQMGAPERGFDPDHQRMTGFTRDETRKAIIAKEKGLS